MKRREPINPIYLMAITLIFLGPILAWGVMWLNSLLSLEVKLAIIWVVAAFWLAYEWKYTFSGK